MRIAAAGFPAAAFLRWFPLFLCVFPRRNRRLRKFQAGLLDFPGRFGILDVKDQPRRSGAGTEEEL